MEEYHCLREKVANLKLENRKIAKPEETAVTKLEGSRIAQLNLLHQQEIKAWESKLNDAVRRLGAHRAEADKEKHSAAAQVNSLVAKLERLEKSSKGATAQLAVQHQHQIEQLTEEHQREREAWHRKQKEQDEEHKRELEDKLSLVKAKSLAACKEVLEAEAQWKQRHAALLEETTVQRARLAELQTAVEQLTRTADEAVQGQTHWKVESETAAVKHRRQTAGLQQQLQVSRAALVSASVTHRAELDQLRAAQHAELELYRKQKSRDLEELETRVRETVSRKDEQISGLRRDLAAASRQVENMETLLRQLQNESTLQEAADCVP